MLQEREGMLEHLAGDNGLVGSGGLEVHAGVVHRDRACKGEVRQNKNFCCC